MLIKTRNSIIIALAAILVLILGTSTVFAADPSGIKRQGDEYTFMKDMGYGNVVTERWYGELWDDSVEFFSTNDKISIMTSSLSAENNRKMAYYTGALPKGTTNVPGEFGAIIKGIVHLQDGTTADLKYTYSNIKIRMNYETQYGINIATAPTKPTFRSTHPGYPNGVDPYYTSQPLPDGTWARPGGEMDVKIEVVKDGVPVENVKYIWGIWDLDQSGLNVKEDGTYTNGTYERGFTTDHYGVESAKILNGAISDIHITNGNFLNITADKNFMATKEDGGSWHSGYALLGNNGVTAHWSALDAETCFAISTRTGSAFHIVAKTVGDHKDGGYITTDALSPTLSTENENKTYESWLDVPESNDAAYTIHVKEGYVLDTVKVDGEEITPTKVNDTTYTYDFNNVRANHEIEASFKKETSVTTRWLPEDGSDPHNTFPDPVKEDGYAGDPYETEQKTFKNYEFTRVDGTPSGNMQDEPITVTYYYRLKNGTLTVKHVDEEGRDLTPSVTTTEPCFTEYETSAREFTGYELKETPTNANGTYNEDPTTVTYVYKLKDVSLIVNHVDEDGNVLSPQEVTTKKWFDEYETSQKTFDNYKLKTHEGDTSGTLAKEETVVTYIYELKTGDVTAKYVDENGSELASPVTTSGKVTTPYTTSPKEIKNYRLTEVPQNQNGDYTEQPQEVIYVYTPKDADVTVLYVDENDKPLADGDTIEGKVFDEYTTAPKEIPGYDLIIEPTNKNGEMTEDPITVKYVYRAKPAVVTVNYVDEEGNPILPEKNIDGKVFDPYTTEPENIPGYILSVEPANKTGDMAEEPTSVTYVYKKAPSKVIVKHVDKDGKELAPGETIEGLFKDPYQTKEAEIKGYRLTKVPANKEGNMGTEDTIVEYVYERIPSKVTVKFIDEDGKEISEDVTMDGFLYDPYKAEPKDIDGYTLKVTPDNANGEFAEEDQTVTFIYAKNKEPEKEETPKEDTPKEDTLKKDTPKKDTPKEDTPKKEIPKEDTSAPKKGEAVPTSGSSPKTGDEGGIGLFFAALVSSLATLYTLKKKQEENRG